MAPVRRYLRITKYSVLECRIYLDDPSLAQSWLLNPRDPILPRVIEAIRPLVIPKLREEKERAKKKSTKKKVVKDVIVKDDFEVSVFLTETSTRHSLLTKQTHLRDNIPPLMQSNSSKLTSQINANPIDVEAYGEAPILLEEDSDEDNVQLGDIPLAPPQQQTKRRRRDTSTDDGGDNDGDGDGDGGNDNFGPYDEDGANTAIDDDADMHQPPRKRHNMGLVDKGGDQVRDDKKKLAMDVSYEGFAIYGRVLCLVVKKRDARARQKSLSSRDAGQASMENWITSTQVPVGGEDVD